MAIAYRTSSSDDFYSSPTVSIPALSGVVAGDVLLAMLVTNDGSRTLDTLPTGWLIVASATTTVAPGGGFWLCKKLATASEPATYDFVFNYGFNGRVAIAAYSGGDDMSVAGDAAWSSVTSSSPFTASAASVTVPDNSSVLVWFGTSSITTKDIASPAWTEPSGFTERIEAGDSWEYHSVCIADKTANSGASGAANGTLTQAGAGNTRTLGVLVAIAPSGGASTISASGSGESPVVTSIAPASFDESVTVGNYSDVVVTVKDQNGTGIAGLTGTATSSSTSIATVTQLAATDANGQATLRIVGVAPGSSSVTLTVDGVVSNTISTTVVSGSNSRALSVSPATVTLDQSETQQFVASDGSGTAPTVVWTIPSGGGTISSAGLYTAPPSDGSATVRASLASDSAVYAEASVTISSAAFGVVTATLRYRGAALASTRVDYWVIEQGDTVIASGSQTTDSSGALTISVPSQYVGQKVNVVVNNLASDMATAGKIHHQRVVTVT